jgi:hypothetical protein
VTSGSFPPPSSPKPDLGRAGARAQAEGERRRARRIERRREQFGVVGAAIASFSDPQHERAWRDGAAGERRVAARLVKHLKDTGVVVLHDRAIPGKRSNIDHIAVGPGGITVIDAKAIKGKVRAERRGRLFAPRIEHLTVGGRDRTKLIDGLERQVALVADLLVRNGIDDVHLAGCLCLTDAEGLPLLGTVRVRNVPVLATKPTARLAARPGSLGARAIQDLVTLLATKLPCAS